MESPQIQKDTVALIFDKETSFAYLYRKTEKLVSAIYLITDLIKDEDQIKWLLRKNGIELLSDIVSVTRADLIDKRHDKKVAGRLVEIISLFEIASLAKI